MASDSNYEEGAGPFNGTRAEREPHVLGGRSYGDVDDDIIKHTERLPGKKWLIAMAASLSVATVFLVSIILMIGTGLGTQGVNSPNGWGTDIINFVFWIGIGHAGTLISAILFLFRQKWRTAVNRSAEAMTIFAVATASIFPLLHIGRPYYAYWLAPIPNGRGPLWVNFSSPLTWDIFAISTYATISVVFWYVGLLPDLATVRDRATNPWRRTFYSILCLGWNGSNRAWRHYESTYLLLAGLATPLVFSVHTVVSFDFATTIIPGWHSTIFPPYFVIGAIFSGFAMVLTLMIMMRHVYSLKNYITVNTLESMAKILLMMGMLVGFAYTTEFFMAWYSGNEYEGFIFQNRAFGAYWWAYLIMFTCNAFVPQIFWFKAARRSIPVLFTVSILVNVGMWFERYVIIITSLHRDFLPSSWGMFIMTKVDWGLTIGGFGFFFTLFLLYVRIFPTVAGFEVKGVMNADEATGRLGKSKGGAHG